MGSMTAPAPFVLLGSGRADSMEPGLRCLPALKVVDQTLQREPFAESRQADSRRRLRQSAGVPGSTRQNKRQKTPLPHTNSLLFLAAFRLPPFCARIQSDESRAVKVYQRRWWDGNGDRNKNAEHVKTQTILRLQSAFTHVNY